ncbi:MAG TPA: (Fe-S)-binding protein [Motilibacteraceae bacterium]|nr:(Fe-S)-binding protein [Motilibacteraceae bacterium]
MQVLAVTVAIAVTLVALALVVQAALRITSVVQLGQPDPARKTQYGQRTRTMLTETLGHTRMLKWSLVGSAHWFVFVGFGALFFTLVTAYGQLFDAEFALPLIGGWIVYDVLTEAIAVLTGIGIAVLILIRLRTHPRKLGRKSRFAGSTFWQAYYVEWTIVGIVACVLALRGLEGALAQLSGYSAHYFLSYPLVKVFSGLDRTQLENGIYLVAAAKIVISMAWFITIALNLTMGVAWHRFTAFFNIFFKRNPRPARGADGAPLQTGQALGPLKPVMSGGKLVDFEDPGEDDVFGVGQVEHFTWKGLLDFTTCTECGRCQSQCPAWNTGKPLSPKLVITTLRDHAYAKAPYLMAGGGKDLAGEEKLSEGAYEALPEGLREEAERPLVGTADDGGVIDPDVLWSCTTCGACVEQCPVDIEHVDHIVDMRRYQVLIESSFPSELGGLFKNLEKSGNPWGSPASARMDWAKGLDFEVPVIGETAESAEGYDYLFWVGCAGAFEDRAKRTTRAVAELLHTAGVSFAVLGSGETCTGDPARRSGNEFLFQMLAAQNVATLHEARATTIVVTCPHCFNTIGREYEQVLAETDRESVGSTQAVDGKLAGDFTVVHHTQLLNKLVREKRLVPVQRVEEKVTYHDPCYLGRHNQVYTPPREILGSVPGLELTEMARNKNRSFCCGAGGARMWMEERIGKRINLDRVDEALGTGSDKVAVGCPFCRVMVSDGVTARQGEGAASEDVEVLDVAQMLLRSVKGDGDKVAVSAGHADAVDAESPLPEGGSER